MLLRSFNRFQPSGLECRRVRRIDECFGEIAIGECSNDLKSGFLSPALLHHIIPLASLRIRNDVGLARYEVRE